MKIPAGELDRYQFFNDVANQCLESRNDRISMYERLRSYYLFGCSTDNDPATYNKILPAIDLLVSFLFAAETTRFGIVIGESADAKKDLEKVPTMQRHLNDKWHESNADVVYSQAITWALVYNSMFVKLIQRGKRTIPMLVDPHSIGVLREDLPFLDDQDAFVHTYTVSKTALERLLTGHPRATQIVNTVSASMRPEPRDVPAGVQRIIMSTFPMVSGPNGPGQITSPYNLIDAYRPRIVDERVEMRELWVWDDDENDYWVATVASGGVCVFDRKNPEIPQEHPFIQVCPNPSYDYFFGHSEVDRLTQLQDFRETRLEQIAELLTRAIKPPTSLRGQWQGIVDETNFAMQTFGASMQSQDPMAEVKTYAPTVPPDTFAEIREIDSMFFEMIGLNNVVQGRGDAGVRSKGHAAELARLGSARVRKRAFTLEDGLDKFGDQYLARIQTYDDTHLKYTHEGKEVEFIANQFTKDRTVKVDGHSSSPIFVEDQKELAFALFEARAIDRGELLEATAPPGLQVKLQKLKTIEANEQKQRAEEAKLKLAGGGSK